MAVTSHRKVARRALKQPDEFVLTLDWIGDWVAANFTRVIIGVVGVIVAVVIIFAFSFYSQHRQRIASGQFYQSINALTDRNYQAAAKGFGKLAHKDSGIPLGNLANLYLGSTWLAQNQPAKARDAIQKYLADSGNHLFRQMALVQLGVANEDLSNYRDAHAAYVRASQLDGPQKGRAQIGIARTLASLGDRQGAIAAYQQFLRDNPFAPERPEVVEALAQIGAPPEPIAPNTKSPASENSSAKPTGH